MKLNTAPRDLAVTSDNVTTSEFSIRNSAKAFSILSSGLYTNKIRAIIRELSCNAVDAQVEAGNADAQFELHLPNDLEPYFSIRDFGTGLDHEGVTKLYSTYFESTKTESNDYIGALGLGSKSPFSYTDNFTVTAIKNGQKGIYTAFINDQGVPSIATLSRSETDEPSGLEIYLNVKREDFRDFRAEAVHVFRYFQNRPKILNCPNFVFEDVEYEERDIVPGVHIRKDIYGRSSRARAIMGNIAYPLELTRDQVAEELYHFAENCALDIEFKLGDIEFAANREALSLTPDTIKAIERRLAVVGRHALKHVDEAMGAEPNHWKKRALLRKLAGLNLYKSIAQNYEKRHPELARNHIRFDVDDLATKYNIEIKGLNPDTYYKAIRKLNAETDYNAKKFYWPLGGSSSTLYVIQDTKRGAYNRLRHHLNPRDRRAAFSNVYLLAPVDKNRPMDTDALFRDLLDPLNIMKASELDEMPTTGPGSKKNEIFRYITEGQRGYSRSWIWDSKPIDLAPEDHEHVWAVLDEGNHAEVDGVKRDFKYIAGRFYSADVSRSKVTFCAVAKSRVKLVENRKGWISLADFIQKKVDEWLARDNLLRMAVAETNVPYMGKLIEELDSGVLYDNRHILAARPRNDYQNIVRVLELFKKVDPFEDACQECFAARDAMYKAYPMLSVVDNDNRHAKLLLDYIKLVDSATATGEK